MSRYIFWILVALAIHVSSSGNKKEKRIVISQSNHIPWKGSCDLIASVDEFITYDEVQYTCQDWRNKNIIKASSGVQ